MNLAVAYLTARSHGSAAAAGFNGTAAGLAAASTLAAWLAAAFWLAALWLTAAALVLVAALRFAAARGSSAAGWLSGASRSCGAGGFGSGASCFRGNSGAAWSSVTSSSGTTSGFAAARSGFTTGWLATTRAMALWLAATFPLRTAALRSCTAGRFSSTAATTHELEGLNIRRAAQDQQQGYTHQGSNGSTQHREGSFRKQWNAQNNLPKT